MSLNVAGRVALRVLGAYLIASGLIVLAGGFNRPLVVTLSDDSLLSNVFVSALAGIASSALFCFLPGLYFLMRSDSLANRLFPETDSLALSLNAEALLPVLLTVLGVLLLARGIAGLAGSAAYLLVIAESEDTLRLAVHWQTFVSSIATLGCGWFLVRFYTQRAPAA